MQEGFIVRTEKLLRQHQQRAEIHDGLKGLTNQEIINKVVESPNKLKRQAKGLLHILQKHKVSLKANGDVDYS